MTDQASGLESEDEEKRSKHLEKMREAAGFKEGATGGSQPVWELIKWGFRSQEVCQQIIQTNDFSQTVTDE